METAFLLAALIASATPDSAEDSVHLVVGEAVKIDLLRRRLTVKTGEAREVRELEIAVDEVGTRITAGGRTLRLEDVRPGEGVVASCSDDGAGRHQARLIKVRSSRHAPPSPAAGTGKP